MSKDLEQEKYLIIKSLQEKLMHDMIAQFSLLTPHQKLELIENLSDFYCVKCACQVIPGQGHLSDGKLNIHLVRNIREEV